MINRAAIILKYKEPAVQWINDADPDPQVSIGSVNHDRTVYLISDHGADDDTTLARWIKQVLAGFEVVKKSASLLTF